MFSEDEDDINLESRMYHLYQVTIKNFREKIPKSLTLPTFLRRKNTFHENYFLWFIHQGRTFNQKSRQLLQFCIFRKSENAIPSKMARGS